MQYGRKLILKDFIFDKLIKRGNPNMITPL